MLTARRSVVAAGNSSQSGTGWGAGGVAGTYAHLTPTASVLPLAYDATRMAWDSATARFTKSTINTTEPTWATTDSALTDTGNAATNYTNLLAKINNYCANATGNTRILVPVALHRGAILPDANTSGFWIGLYSASHASLPTASDGTSCGTKTSRVNPTDHASLMPELCSATAETSPLYFTSGRNKFWMRGLNFTNRDGTSLAGGLVSAAEECSDITVQQCLSDGYDDGTTNKVRRAYSLSGTRMAVVDSYADRIGQVGSDSQFFLGLFGPGPFKVTNNYSRIGGPSENIYIGGGSLSGTTDARLPKNVDVRGNVCDKPAWGNHKNHIEVKYGTHILIAQNECLFSNGLGQAPGHSIMIKLGVDGLNPTSNTQHVTIHSNRMLKRGISLSGPEGQAASLETYPGFFDVRNNLVSDSPRCLSMTDEIYDVAVQYNTLRTEQGFGGALDYYAGIALTGDQTGLDADRLDVQYNVIATNYGFYTAVSLDGGSATGSAAFAIHVGTTYTYANNLVACDVGAANHAGNVRVAATAASIGFVNDAGGDWRLASSSQGYRVGPNSVDLGADIALLTTMMSEVV